MMGRSTELIISTWIDSLGWEDAVERVMAWAQRREPRYVCICNVHSVVTAGSDVSLRGAINDADLATPDGMPVAWLIGHRRGSRQPRVNGPDLTVALCREAARRGVVVAFYGSTPETLDLLSRKLPAEFPGLRLGAMISPPFRALREDERCAYVEQLNESGAGIIFVGLGCPKQEVWMAAQQREIKGVLIGVGAAFEFMAGTVLRPPKWMQRLGLEWLGRLLAEPKRLWRRYMSTNLPYLAYLARELLSPRRDQRRDET